MTQTTSPSGALDQGNLKKILKGLAINAAGAILAYLLITTFPQILALANSCLGDSAKCNGISPHSAQLLVFLVPLSATIINVFKEYFVNYSGQ